MGTVRQGLGADTLGDALDGQVVRAGPDADSMYTGSLEGRQDGSDGFGAVALTTGTGSQPPTELACRVVLIGAVDAHGSEEFAGLAVSDHHLGGETPDAPGGDRFHGGFSHAARPAVGLYNLVVDGGAVARRVARAASSQHQPF